MEAGKPLRTAVVGFGVSGRVFHAPLIAANPAYSLDVIVTGNPDRAAQAKALYPGAKILANPEAVFAHADGLDLVVLGTPPANHYALTEQAVRCGLNVVVDKPFVPTSAEGEELITKAGDAGVVLSVFQNRRWDGDFLTVRKLLDGGHLGDVRTFESRFEWWMPEGFQSWKDEARISEGGGILFDLGTHLIDQAIMLFGAVKDVHAEAARHSASRMSDADEDTFVSLLHESGVRSRLWMNGLAARPAPRFHVLGSRSAYTKWGLDGQEPALEGGLSPSDLRYGVEPESRWGALGTGEKEQLVPTERGSYPEYYRLLAGAIRSGGKLPVDPADSVAVLKIIEEIHGLL